MLRSNGVLLLPHLKARSQGEKQQISGIPASCSNTQEYRDNLAISEAQRTESHKRKQKNDHNRRNVRSCNPDTQQQCWRQLQGPSEETRDFNQCICKSKKRTEVDDDV